MLTRNPWTDAPSRQRPDPCADDCTTACPACGGLKCLCRPHFFPGQLLSDEDLNRLEQYVVDKNKLRNRYLHGWGVACGLEVVCDGCAPESVVVRSGYALSPCGDDIVVCGDQSVNICDLINACEPREPRCEPPYERQPRDCRGGRSKWVLGICYDERPSRGITAQVGAGDDACHGSCGCGGGSGGGCGCGGATKKANGSGSCGCGGTTRPAASKRREYKPQCEPTQICEGYRFVVYPAEREDWGVDISKYDGAGSDALLLWLYANRARFGPLIERVLCCVIKGMQLRATIREGKPVDGYAAVGTYTEYAEALAEFAEDFAIHRCAFLTKTATLRPQSLDIRRRYEAGQLDMNEVSAGLAQLDMTWLDIISECFCSALLPQCPAPAKTNCVPLAVITLQGDGCRVEEICNWEARKLLITWPTVTYWLSWLPWNRLREWISTLCCGDGRERSLFTALLVLLGTTASKAAASATPTKTAPAKYAMTDEATMSRAFASDNLLLHMLSEFEGLKTQDLGAGAYPMWANIAAKIGGGGAAKAFTAKAAPVAADDTMTRLTQRLENAEKKLAAQDKEIAALRKKK